MSDPHLSRTQIATGIRLQLAETGRRDGDPLLLLHGYTDSWYSFSGIMPALGHHWRVLAPDQRGHGGSDRPSTGYSVADLARDALALLDELGLQQAAVLGHSMGSLVAQEIALTAPHRVTALVLAGSAAHLRSAAVLALKQEIDGFADEVPEAFVREFQLSTTNGPIDERFMTRVVEESLKVPAFVWKAALAGQLAVDNSASLGRISAPTLVLRGGSDQIFELDAQAAVARSIPGAREIIYEDTGHALHWERPEEVARDVGEFLGAQASAKEGVAIA